MALGQDTSEENSVVLGLMYYSDATQLTGKGNKYGHPVVFSLANIPLTRRKKIGSGYKLLGMLPDFSNIKDPDATKQKASYFNQCLELLMSPFKHFSHTGLEYKGFKLYPFLYAYVHDYPEGCKVRDTATLIFTD